MTDRSYELKVFSHSGTMHSTSALLCPDDPAARCAALAELAKNPSHVRAELVRTFDGYHVVHYRYTAGAWADVALQDYELLDTTDRERGEVTSIHAFREENDQLAIKYVNAHLKGNHVVSSATIKRLVDEVEIPLQRDNDGKWLKKQK